MRSQLLFSSVHSGGEVAGKELARAGTCTAAEAAGACGSGMSDRPASQIKGRLSCCLAYDLLRCCVRSRMSHVALAVRAAPIQLIRPLVGLLPLATALL
jgi:hypothetical protein